MPKLFDDSKLELALQIMSDKEVELYEKTCDIAEKFGIDVFQAMEIAIVNS